MSAKPIKEELFDFFNYYADFAFFSAFVHARDKFLPDIFESLSHKVNSSFPLPKTYHNYSLIAIDGSDLLISYDPVDIITFYGKGKTYKGNNQYHINTTFDILNNRFADAIINGTTHIGKQESMWKMVERYDGYL